ncbi:MAG: hypothetical protein JWN86_465, partial [Planctomycetota bacterium]|nr:hypothetical protein [Planctomycetota bacterium]
MISPRDPRSELGSLRRKSLSRLASRRKRSTMQIESLESRLLLASGLDLKISAATAPPIEILGGTATVQFTVMNVGSEPASTAWYDGVYLSDDTEFDPKVDQAIGYQYEGDLVPLVAGASADRILDVAIPVDATPGSRHLLFVVDAFSQLTETDTTNNVLDVPVTLVVPKVDLVVSTVDAPTQASPGDSLAVNWTITNQNVESASNAWFDSVYLSPTPTFDATTAVPLGDLYADAYIPLGSGAGYATSLGVVIPASSALGTQYLLVVTDSGGSQPETDETNNVRAVPITLSIGDLAVSTPSAPASARLGDSISISFQVSNVGSGIVTPSRYDAVYLSDSPTLNDTSIALGFYVYGGPTLTSGDQYTVSGTIDLPGQLALGSRYLVFVADAGGTRPESNETNNTMALPITILGRADLIVGGSASPASIRVGDQAGVSFLVMNSGSDVAAGNWTDSVYLSTKPFLDASALLLSMSPRSGQPSLAIGESYSVAKTVSIPPATSPGAAYFLFVADDGNGLKESDETNNLRAVAVNVLPAPELTVTAISSPPLAGVGRTIAVSYTVKNTGSADAFAGFDGTSFISWSDSLYLSDDPFLDVNDTFLDSAPRGSILSKGDSYVVNRNVAVPTISTGAHYLLVMTDATNQIPESDETDNVRAIPLTVSPTDTNLSVISATAPAAATAGDTIGVSYTVKNLGTTPASALWYDSVYLSDTPNLDASSLLITTQARPDSAPLAGGASYTTANVFFLVPATARPTTQYLLFVTDVYDQQAESDEHNVKAIPFTLKVPDLAASSPSAPASAVVGVPFSVSFLVTNAGASPAVKSWYDGVYLSAVPTFDASAVLLASQSQSGHAPLDPGGKYLSLLNVTLPRTAVGSHFLLLVTDAFGAAGDINRTNNVQAVPVNVHAPDLIVTTASAAASTVSVNGQVQVSWTVGNQGDAAGPANWPDTIYLSDKPFYDFTATSLATLSRPNQVALASGDSYSLSQFVTIPTSAKTGNRYLLVVADGNNQVFESDESNNTYALPITVGAPDLTTTSVNAPASASLGGQITVSWNDHNSGAFEAPANWTDQIYLSADPILDVGRDTLLGSQQHVAGSPLPPGADASLSQIVSLPASTQIRNGYLLVVADGTRLQGETDETNNVTAVPFTIVGPGANLTVTSITAPSQIVVAASFPLSWTVKNVGSIPTTGGSWFDSVYLSTRSVFDGSALGLGSYFVGANAPLSAGDMYTLTRTVTIPAALLPPTGDIFLLVQADQSNSTSESAEDDNFRAFPVRLTYSYDLAVSKAAAPSNALVGSSIPVSWTVKNLGSASTIVGWSDSLYLSSDPTLDLGDTLLGQQVPPPQTFLNASGTYSRDRNVLIPADAATGSRYLLVVTDSNHSLDETDESNNVLAVPLSLGSVDLAISAANGPISAVVGDPIQVGFTVTNQGDSATTASWSDFIYLSTDDIYDSSDLYLGSYDRGPSPPAIAPGSSYSVSPLFSIPDRAASGLHHLLFVTNRDRQQIESNTVNDVCSIPIDLGAPNLSVTALSAPAAAVLNPGAAIGVSWSVVNTGSVPARANWIDSVYVSDKATFDATATLLGSLPHSSASPLDSEGKYDASLSVKFPPSVPAGATYLLLVTDATGRQGETDETNNVRAVPITLGLADLVVSDATVPATATLGETISVSWTVSNPTSFAAQGFGFDSNINSPTYSQYYAAVWKDSVFLSDMPTLNGSETPLATDAHLSLDSGGHYNVTKNVVIPDSNRVGSYYLIIRAGDPAGVRESNLANDLYVIPITLLPKDVELTVSHADSPATAQVGQTVRVEWTVTNVGSDAATARWFDSIYLSDDPFLNFGDTRLVARTVDSHAPLSTSASYTHAENVTIPATLTGNRYLLIVTDADGSQAESNETNNVLAVPISIAGPGVDLIVPSVTSPATASLNQAITVTAIVKNQGSSAALSGWNDQLFLSMDSTFDASDLFIAQSSSFPPLDPNASYGSTLTGVIPGTLGTGSRFLLVVANANRGQSETNTANNVSAFPITLGAPDLVITSAQGPATAASGGTVSLSYTLTNSGSFPAIAAWNDAVYVSTKATFDASARQVAVRNRQVSTLAAGGSEQVNLQGTIPGTTAPGDAYLLFVADADHLQTETDETDDVRAIPIHVAAGDLVVSSLSTPGIGVLGGQVTVTWTVTNQGSQNSAGIWQDNVYVSDSPTFDSSATFVSTFYRPDFDTPLAAGSSYAQTQTLTVPASSATGSRFLIIVADANSSLVETDETNNSRSASIAIVKTVDLTITSATAPAAVILGDSVPISFTVKNVGVSTLTGSWFDRIYLSNDPVLDIYTDQVVATIPTTNPTTLAADGSYTVARNITIAATATGNRWLLFVTDAGSGVSEINESNNLVAIPVLLAAPDLIVSAATAPVNASIGTSIAFSYTVKNQGAVDAPRIQSDAVYVSDFPTLDYRATLLTNTGGLPVSRLVAGGSYSVSSNVTLPPSTKTDARYLLFAADNTNLQPETDETNNVFAVPIQIQAPDLVVASISLPPTAQEAATIDVSWTISNLGDGLATGPWTDTLLLSDDATAGNDTLLKTVVVQATLAPGQSTTVTTSITLPKGVTGDRHLVVRADDRADVAENDETNNILVSGATVAIGLQPAPNLQVTLVSAPVSGRPGQTIAVSWTVKNSGAVDAAGSWTDRIVLSPLGTVLASVTHNGGLAVGAHYDATTQVTLPVVADGTYQIVIQTDADGVVAEGSKENDNQGAADPPLLVGHPDLVPSILTIPATAAAGSTIGVDWSVANNGMLPADGSWIDQVILSTESNLHSGARFLLGQQTHAGPLASGDSYKFHLDVKIPNDASGPRFILIYSDATLQVNEAGAEDNNLVAAPVLAQQAPYPDLAVSNVNVQSAVAIGNPATATIGWTVVNLGSGAGAVANWVDRVYATPTAFPSATPSLIAEFTHSGLLAASGHYTRSESIRLPRDYTGNYRISVVTDATGVVFENGSTANNTGSSSQLLGVATTAYADLVPASFVVPTTAGSGKSLNVSWNVLNQGIATTDLGAWNDIVTLTTDPDGVHAVATLGVLGHVGALAVGGSYARTADLSIPNGLSGTYYLALHVNSTAALTASAYESIHTDNNLRVSGPIQVNFTPPPDLVVGKITAPLQANSGSKIDVAWTVLNNGQGGASSNWTDVVELKDIANPTANPVVLGAFMYTAGLESGRSYTRSEQFSLPANLRGLFQVVVETNFAILNQPRLYEGARTDNNVGVATESLSLVLPDRPDLQILKVEAPAIIQAGAGLTFDFDVINAGPGATTTPHWIDRVFLSPSTTLGGDAVLLGSFDNGAALGSGGSYRTHAGGLVIPDRFRGPAYLIVSADATDLVNEFPNETNNNQIVAITIKPAPLADLVTSAVAAPDQAIGGTTIEVDFHVANLGLNKTDASGWTDTVWLSHDRTRPTPIRGDLYAKVIDGDIKLGDFFHSGVLDVGQGYDQKVQITLPKKLYDEFTGETRPIAGQWYITAWSNTYGVVTEESLETNLNPDELTEIDSSNYKARPISLLTPPSPDLVVTSILAPAQAPAGTHYTVSWTVQNQGTGATDQDQNGDKVFLSDQPVLDGAHSWYLGRADHLGRLDAGGSYTASLDVDLSPAISGRYLVVMTNVGTAMRVSTDEGPYRSNDLTATPAVVTPAPADLRVSSIVVPSQNFSNQDTSITWTVTNYGAAVWSGTRLWSDHVYISPFDTFDPFRSLEIGTFTHGNKTPLGTGQSYSNTQNVRIPAGYDGKYYLFMQADYLESHSYPTLENEFNDRSHDIYASRVYEGEGIAEDNNLGTAVIAVTYREPDLVVSGVVLPSSPSHAGDTIPISYTVTNRGTRATRQDDWVDRVYLSKDMSLDPSDQTLGEFEQLGALAVGGSYSQTLNVALPIAIEGPYYLLVFTDSNLYGPISPSVGQLSVDAASGPFSTRVPEFADEGNNVTVTPLTILRSELPDLQVTILSVPQHAIVGQTLTLNYAVRNTGNGDASNRGAGAAASWNDTFYLSRDAFLDVQSDRYLGALSHDGGLAAGASYTGTLPLRLPAGLSGTYYLFAVTDPFRFADDRRGTVMESNEANNASSQPVIIDLPPPADLRVDSILIPPSAKSGDLVPLSWTVTNHGQAPATGAWSDTAYLSADGTQDAGDRALGRFSFTGTLQPNQSYTASILALLPASAAGQYRVLVRTDVFNEVVEGPDETNNTTASVDLIAVAVRSLTLGTPLATTLSTGDERLYQIVVSANQTLRITVSTADADAANEVFLRFGRVPTSIDYDAAYQGQLQGNQTATVGSTQAGVYYVLVRGQSEPGSGSRVLIQADSLPFQITDVKLDSGGDARYVTTTISGALFDPHATVKLTRPGFAEIEPVNYRVVDGTRIDAVFDLRGAPHGLYDLTVINPNGARAIVPYRYLVETALPPDVTIGLGGPRLLSPGQSGLYGFTLQSTTNVDTPYVFYQFGVPEMGENPVLFNLPYVVFNTSAGAAPNVANVAWAEVVSAVDVKGENIAPGYAVDLPDGSFAGVSFTALTYPGLQAALDQHHQSLTDFDPYSVAFQFHIEASATPMTRDEFLASQRAEAANLRAKILADPTASKTLLVLAANAGTWSNLYLTGLTQAGLLRPEDQPPGLRDDPQLVSLIATLSAGLLAGPAGKEIITGGNLAGFFTSVRRWYGNDPAQVTTLGDSHAVIAAFPPSAESLNLNLSAKTHTESFNIYVPYSFARPDASPVVPVPALDFSGLLNGASGATAATLTGPLGYGLRQFLPTGQALPYTVQFQNDPRAVTSVGEVRVVQKLDPNLDLRSFRVGDIKLGDLQVHIPSGRGSFQGDFDFTASRGFILRVSAGLDLSTRTASWLLQAIDPQTGEVLRDTSRGLLAPNDLQGHGSGYVGYTIKPKDGLPTGTTIQAQARVLFNTAAPQDTAILADTIDSVAPTTSLTAVPVEAGSAELDVRWTATDEAGGSGVAHVTVYVSQDGGDYAIWLSQSTDVSGIFYGEAGHSYRFLALATDNAGNRESPPMNIQAPDDGSGANLGSLPELSGTTTSDLGTPPSPTTDKSPNPLFNIATSLLPSAAAASGASEFGTVVKPFIAGSFATGIAQSYANIGPMALLPLADGSLLASGGAGRNEVFHIPKEGGAVGSPLATLDEPIYDLGMDATGNLWATTGGGPLLELDANTGAILGRFGDGLTQTLAIQRGSGLIYVSSGKGIEVFDPTTQGFRHFSTTRVNSLAFGPDGALWATSWPTRGDIVRFDDTGHAQAVVHLDSPADSITFGQAGTRLAGLLFVSNNAGSDPSLGGSLTMVDLATLRRLDVATAGSRGANIRATADGRVFLSQTHEIDVLTPIDPPHVASVYPSDGSLIALPQDTISITFDRDMFIGTASQFASVLNPANYSVKGEIVGDTPIAAVAYDSTTRTAYLRVEGLEADHYRLEVKRTVQSLDGLALSAGFASQFIAVTDLSALLSIRFTNARSDRGDHTISYDVIVTSKSTSDLLLPLVLNLSPMQQYDGAPLGTSGQSSDGTWLIDLSASLPGGVLHPGASTVGRTITVYNPSRQRVAFDPTVSALPQANAAPSISSQPITSATTGAWYTYAAAATDPNGEPVTFVLYQSPLGMTLDSATGLIRWTPGAASPGQADVVVLAYDTHGSRAVQEFIITVGGVNRPPVIADLAAVLAGTEGQPLRIDVIATDADGDRLMYWADSLPAGAHFDAASHALLWTPGGHSAGTYPGVRFSVSDGLHTVSRTVTLEISPAASIPLLARPTDRVVNEGDEVRFTLIGSDPDGVRLTYSSPRLPPGATLNPTTGAFQWTPSYVQHGLWNIPFVASNGVNSITQTITMTVLNVNAAPLFDNLDRFQIVENQALTFQAFAFDPDNPNYVPPSRNSDGTLTPLLGTKSSVTYSVTGLPNGASFDRDTARFSWTPGYDAAGSYQVTFVATDEGDGTGVPQTSGRIARITVINANRAPQLIAIANQTLARGASLDLLVQATDPDGEALALTANGLPALPIPAFATFTDHGDGTATLHFAPGTGDRGIYPITLRVQDGGDG